MMPSPLIHSCVAVKYRNRQVLTAVRTVEDQLCLVSWRVNADGTVVKTGTTLADHTAVTQVRMVQARKFIVACRTLTGQLVLSSWDVSNIGAIYAAGRSEVVETDLRWIELLALSPTRLLTCALTAQMEWRFMTWDYGDDDTFTLLHSYIIPATDYGALALTPVPDQGTTTQFVAAMHVASDRLRWTRWLCTEAGELQVVNYVERYRTDVIDLAMLTLPDTAGRGQPLVTIMQRTTGELHVVTDRLDETGIVFHQAHCATIAQNIRNFGLMAVSNGFVALHHSTNTQLTVARWQLSEPMVAARSGARTDMIAPSDDSKVDIPTNLPMVQQWQLQGYGTMTTADVSDVFCCNAPLDGNAPILTGLNNQEGVLHLTSWRAS
ncbi:MAG: hypothetical protein R3C14_04260 [Caldilineaceae bacterium]